MQFIGTTKLRTVMQAFLVALLSILFQVRSARCGIGGILEEVAESAGKAAVKQAAQEAERDIIRGAERTSVKIAVSAAVVSTAFTAFAATTDQSALKLFLTWSEGSLAIIASTGETRLLTLPARTPLALPTLLGREAISDTLKGGVAVYLSHDVLQHMPAFEQQLFEHASVFLAPTSGDMIPLRRIGHGETAAILADVRRNVSVSLQDPSLLERVRGYLDAPFRRDEVGVFSLFDETADFETVNALNPVGTRNLADREEILAELSRTKRRLVLVIGHVEGDELIVRDAVNSIRARIPISDLYRAAGDEVAVIVLGRESSLLRSMIGRADKVLSLDLADQLLRSLEAQSLGGFFDALGGAGSYLVFQEGTDGRLGMILQAQMVTDDQPTSAAGRSTTRTVVARFPQPAASMASILLWLVGVIVAPVVFYYWPLKSVAVVDALLNESTRQVVSWLGFPVQVLICCLVLLLLLILMIRRLERHLVAWGRDQLVMRTRAQHA